MGKRVILILFGLFLTACQTTPAVPTPIGPVTRPDLVTLINWERSPLAVVFRAEIATTDTTSFARRNDISDCTIYGDNRIVFTAPTGVGLGVIWQRVSDEAIRLFVEDLTLNYKIYNQTAGADTLAADIRPEQIETLTLVVNGQAHRADAVGGWPDDYYRLIAERCRAVADSPAELVPTEAYISVEPAVYNDFQASSEWSAGNGVDLAALSSERVWMTGGPVQALWDAQRAAGADVQFRQNDATFHVAVEVPGVTRFAPPPP